MFAKNHKRKSKKRIGTGPSRKTNLIQGGAKFWKRKQNKDILAKTLLGAITRILLVFCIGF